MFPKVLIACPQNEIKNYCWEKWSKRVKDFTYPNYDVFIADNSPTKDNIELIKSCGFIAHYTKPHKKGVIETINASHNACRKYAIDNKYDFMLHLESDVIPPFDIIEQLMQHNKQICCGVYDIFHGKQRKLMAQLNEEYDKSVRAYRTVNYAEEREPLFFNGGLQQVYHAGIGCALIKMDVFDEIKFRVEKGVDFHSDTWFATDCYLYNIPIYIDTNIQCSHLNSTWLTVAEDINKFKENGKVR